MSVIVGFEPIDATLDVPDVSSNLGTGYDQPLLSYRVRLARVSRRGSFRSRRERIKLSTEEEFEALDASILILEETEQLKKEYLETCRKLRQRAEEKSGERSDDDQPAIGYMSYVAAFNDLYGLDSSPARCLTRVLVPKNTFAELLTTARLGRVPSYISIEVDGMDYGPDPDGSVTEWDNKTFPELSVRGVSFGSIPLAAQTAVSNEPDGDLSDHRLAEMQSNMFLPTRSQLNEISTKLDVLAIEGAKGLRLLLWVILGISVLFLILFLLRS